MTKKIMAGAGVLATAAILATALAASAQTTVPAPTAVTTTNEPQVLNVGQNGNVLLRGKIASIANGTMTVQGWGGTWTVNIPASASVFPAAAASNYATAFQTGDFVGVQGTIDTSANWTVNATLVRDWTYRTALTSQEKANAQAAQGIRNGYPRDYVGTASNVSASSLTLTASNGTAYTVNPGANAEIVSRGWATLPFASIQNGDNVRVYGVNASGTITASIIRDVTLPVTATSSTH